MTPSNDLVSVSTGALLHVSSTEALTTVTDFSEANSDSFFSRVQSLHVTLASGASSSFEVVAWARLADGSVAVFSPLSSPAFVLFANKTVSLGADTDVPELLARITGSGAGLRALEDAAEEPLHRRLPQIFVGGPGTPHNAMSCQATAPAPGEQELLGGSSMTG